MINAISNIAAGRADRDNRALTTTLGITTADHTGNTDTFFPPGTKLCEFGARLARRDRADFLRLPTIGDAMEALSGAVQREERADHFVDLGGISVDYLGRIVTERDLHTAFEVARLVPSETGWSRLASFAPDDVPSALRSNVNGWAGRRRGDQVRVRTRLSEDGRERELYAVVGKRYVPYDLDAIAHDVAAQMPPDARARVRYDRGRARIDVLLCNPHHFPADSGAASVGEAHRLALRITTADDGTGGFRLRWMAERIRCVNLTLLKGEATVCKAAHTRKDLVEMIQASLKQQGTVMEGFAAAWRKAWTDYYIDASRGGDRLDGLEALRRMVFHGLVRIRGLRTPDVWAAVRDAWDAEPGDSVASVHNAVTRAAHQAKTERSWSDDDLEEAASDLLYQRVHVLAAIPQDAEDDWAQP